MVCKTWMPATSAGMTSQRFRRADRTQRAVTTASQKNMPRRRKPTRQVCGVAAPGLLDRHLQVLGRTERHFLAGLDLDGFTGRRVSAHASCARPDLQDAEARNPDPLAFLEMLGDQGHEVAEDRLARAFGEFVISRQPCRQMLERNRTAGLATHCHRFARHDACPPQSREMRSWPKKYDSRREGKQSFHFNIKLVRLAGRAGRQACRLLAWAFAAHFGIDPGTKQNHNGNVVPPAASTRPDRKSVV